VPGYENRIIAQNGYYFCILLGGIIYHRSTGSPVTIGCTGASFGRVDIKIAGINLRPTQNTLSAK
jgi:hypothetical protein